MAKTPIQLWTFWSSFLHKPLCDSQHLSLRSFISLDLSKLLAHLSWDPKRLQARENIE